MNHIEDTPLSADAIVSALPAGYRWADEDETDNWTALRDRMVQVRVGGTDLEPLTDLAMRSDKTPEEAKASALRDQSIAEFARWVTGLADSRARIDASMNLILSDLRIALDVDESADARTIAGLRADDTAMSQYAAWLLDLDQPCGGADGERRFTKLDHIISRAQAALDGHKARPSHHPMCDSDLCHSDCPTAIWKRIGDESLTKRQVRH